MALINFFRNVGDLWSKRSDPETLYQVGPEDFDFDNFDKKFNINNAVNISAVYTAIKIKAGTISRLPINIYNQTKDGKVIDKSDYRYDLLHYAPNNYLNSQSYQATVETLRNLKGNSLVRIWRDDWTSNPKSFELISPSRVVGSNLINNELIYKIKKINKETTEEIFGRDILHFKSLVSKDGIWAINPIEALRLNLSTTYKALTAIDTFYDNNAMSPQAIKSTVSGANQTAMIQAIEKSMKKYAGYLKAGKWIPLPPNTELQDITLNLKDAQFIATAKFNIGQIAALYGIPPSLMGLFEASKFNSVQMMLDEFKFQELSADLNMYRREYETKLLSLEERKAGKSIEFNDKALIETDYKSRSESYKTMFSVGGVTPNEIRKLEGIASYKDGDKHYVPSNFVSVEDNKINIKE